MCALTSIVPWGIIFLALLLVAQDTEGSSWGSGESPSHQGSDMTGKLACTWAWEVEVGHSSSGDPVAAAAFEGTISGSSCGEHCAWRRGRPSSYPGQPWSPGRLPSELDLEHPPIPVLCQPSEDRTLGCVCGGGVYRSAG